MSENELNESSYIIEFKKIYKSFTYILQMLPFKAKIKLNLKQNDN